MNEVERCLYKTDWGDVISSNQKSSHENETRHILEWPFFSFQFVKTINAADKIDHRVVGHLGPVKTLYGVEEEREKITKAK